MRKIRQLTPQNETLNKIIQALVNCYKYNKIENESSLTHIFFHELYLLKPKLKLLAAEDSTYLSIGGNGRIDLSLYCDENYVSNKLKDKRKDDILLEFKFQKNLDNRSYSFGTLKGDFDKLEKYYAKYFKKEHSQDKGLLPIFINFFDSNAPLDIKKYIKIIDKFAKNKTLTITVCKGMTGFLFDAKKVPYSTEAPVIITNFQKLYTYGFIPKGVHCIITPRKDGQVKSIIYKDAKLEKRPVDLFYS